MVKAGAMDAASIKLRKERKQARQQNERKVQKKGGRAMNYKKLLVELVRGTKDHTKLRRTIKNHMDMRPSAAAAAAAVLDEAENFILKEAWRLARAAGRANPKQRDCQNAAMLLCTNPKSQQKMHDFAASKVANWTASNEAAPVGAEDVTDAAAAAASSDAEAE